MHPLLIFAGGLIAGIAGVRTVKNAKLPETARRGLETAEGGLRRATLSGLETLERSSAALRGRLSPDARAAGPGEADVTAAEPADQNPADQDPAAAHADPLPARRRAAPPPDAPRKTAEKPRKRRRAAPPADPVPNDEEPS